MLELVIGAIAAIATVGTAILHISSSESNISSTTDITEESNDTLKDKVEFFLLKKLLNGIVTIESKISSSEANEKQEQQERIESIASTLEGRITSEAINIAQDIIEQLNDANTFDSVAETIASGVNDVTADYSTDEDAAASFQAEQQNGTWIETVPAYEQEPWTETYPAPENTEPQIESFPATQDEAPTITVFPDAKPEIPSIETIPAETPKELGDNILWNSGNKGVGKAELHHIATDKSKKFDFKNHPAFKETGIDVSKDVDNLVELANHRGRHTYKYHQEIQDRLDAVVERYGGTDKLESAVREELNKMKQELLDGKLDPYQK
ncbi:AHH domain-containing protein [Clostridium saccharobutylicum]|uniref:Uncharacterized protein n=1 Tax=Clostridium saccharobutylicum TaxID=169679 RepID=A0A1S8NHT0_CLOSA|nr:AHH domain-containing protein [Clostridium saccharobutylicum]OOM15990.1 hypothetical protein CLOSAC_02610 [Clostridium saccharobutylicum]